jgi:hypothetical protein
MQHTTLGLLALCIALGGCFSPDETAAESPAANAATSGGVDDAGESGTSGDGVDSANDEPADETTGGRDDLGSTGAELGESSTSAGVDDGADSSTGAIDDPADAGTTGEACELGTPTDCLACGDACSPDGACTPEGCLEPLTLGHAEAFDNLGGLDGFLWGFPVELDAPATLTHVAFIAGGAGGNVQLSVYSDASGAPSDRLVTAPPAFGYAPGVHEIEVPPEELAAGTYWIMATATNPTRLAVDLNGGSVNFAVQGIIHEFAQGHPNVIDDPVAFVNFRPNFYLRLEQLQ